MVELNICPCCGSENTEMYVDGSFDLFIAHCVDCDLEIVSEEPEDEEGLAAKWNMTEFPRNEKNGILACPFCGCEYMDGGRDDYESEVRCEDCGATMRADKNRSALDKWCETDGMYRDR